MQIANNLLSIESARRAGLGLLLGVLVIIPLSFLMSSEQKITSDVIFDSEILQVPDASPKKEISHKNAPRINQINQGESFTFFTKNRVGLTQKQLDAFKNDAPILSVIVTNVGGQKNLNDHIIKTLPHDVTLSISPYLKNHHDVLGALHDHGYEVWMDIAAVTLDMNHDDGPLALNPTLDFESNIELLSQQFGNKDHITGVILPQRSLIVETPRLWDSVVSDLYGQGYGVIDNTRQVTKPSLYFYDDQKAPYIKGDESFAQNIDIDGLSVRLTRVKEKLLETNSMIVTIPVSSPKHIDVLAEWITSIQSENITIVPASAQANL